MLNSPERQPGPITHQRACLRGGVAAESGSEGELMEWLNPKLTDVQRAGGCRRMDSWRYVNGLAADQKAS